MTKIEEYIIEKIKQFVKILHLTIYRFTLTKHENELGVIMSCSFTYPYLDATITYGGEAVELFNNNRLKELNICIMHELCHLITDPIHAKATSNSSEKEINDERERLTDYIAHIILQIVEDENEIYKCKETLTNVKRGVNGGKKGNLM